MYYWAEGRAWIEHGYNRGTSSLWQVRRHGWNMSSQSYIRGRRTHGKKRAWMEHDGTSAYMDVTEQEIA